MSEDQEKQGEDVFVKPTETEFPPEIQRLKINAMHSAKTDVELAFLIGYNAGLKEAFSGRIL